MEQRIVRIPLLVDLIREMDEAILSGLGGYGTRAEFITDAIRERLLELKFEEAEEPASSLSQPSSVTASVQASGLAVSDRPERVATIRLADTAIGPIGGGYVLRDGVDTPAAEPLFGLHNRDYPSLWGLHLLAEMTQDGPIPVADFEAAACKRAWDLVETLRSLEDETGQRLTSLFPKNREKKDASEGAFRIFAIGEHREEGDEVRSAGPLYQWKVAGLIRGDDGMLVGVTEHGHRLLDRLQGVTALSPHDRGHAMTFLDHLRDYAPEDWWGFERVLAAIGRGADTRKELIADFAEGQRDWSPNEVSTNSTGYVARAREWGLLLLKQVDGRYVLTDLGREVIRGRGAKHG